MDQDQEEFLEKRRTQNINQALSRVEEYSWERIRILLFDIFHLEWDNDFETKDYNKGYTEFKCFMQDKSHESFTMFYFAYYLLQLLSDCYPIYLASESRSSIREYLPILERGLLSPILILIMIFTKQKQKDILSVYSYYIIQNLQICLITIYMNYIDTGNGFGVSITIAFIAMSVEFLPFQTLTFLILCVPQLSQITLLPEDYAILQNGSFVVILIIVLTYLELCRYSSFSVEYKQLKANKDNMKKMLGFILQSQTREQNLIYHKNIIEKLMEQDQIKKKKFDIGRFFFYEEDE